MSKEFEMREKNAVVFIFVDTSKQSVMQVMRPDFPYNVYLGGSIETGEDETTAFIREIQEELGVTPETWYRADQLDGVNQHSGRYLVHLIITEWDGKIPTHIKDQPGHKLSWEYVGHYSYEFTDL